MKLVDLKCPNCSSSLVKEGGHLVCHSCGSVFSVDYDESDVEYEKIKTEPERDQRRLQHEKELLEKKFELEQRAAIESENRQQKRTIIRRLIITLIIVFASVSWISLCVIVTMYSRTQNGYSSYGRVDDDDPEPTNTPRPTATPTPSPNYNITPADVEDLMPELIEVGQKAQMDITSCAVESGFGGVDFYTKTDAVFVDAYIVTDIPETRPSQSNRIVLIYEVTWNNEDEGDHTCYDAIYFEGLKIFPNDTKVVCDYDPQTIFRSSAAWGWSMAYSFEEYNQCYRENVSALGGKVTPVEEK